MTASTSLLSYHDCIEFMDRALSDNIGARLRFPDESSATRFRQRLHYARTLHRQANAQTYAKGEMMHGRSEYDLLVCRIKFEDGVYVYLEKNIGAPDGVELLSELPQIEHQPAKQIEHKPDMPKLIEGIITRRG